MPVVSHHKVIILCKSIALSLFSVDIDLTVIDLQIISFIHPLIDGASAIKMINETGCDGIMIGRAAIGNPFIFSEVRAALEGGVYTPPTLDEVIETALFQLRSMIEEKGERVGIAESRKHLCRYLKGFRGSSEARGRVNLANSYEEVEEILRSVASQGDV